MAKYCSNCGNEMQDNAEMCVKCGTLVGNNRPINKNNNKKGLPIWAIVLIVVGCIVLIPIIILGVIAILSYNLIKDADINDIKDKIEDYVEKEENKKTITGTLGDSLIGEDFKITLVKKEKYDSLNDKLPADGKEYLVLFFEVENISDEVERISTFNFNGYVDGKIVFPSLTLGTINDTKLFSDNVDVGKKEVGYVAYEIDKNWKEFEVHYDKYDDIKLVFKILNDVEKQGV